MKSLLEKHWIYTVELCVFAFLMFMCNFKSINPTVFKKKTTKVLHLLLPFNFDRNSMQQIVK